MSVPCPRCSTARKDAMTACSKCGWTPKPSEETRAKPGQGSGIGLDDDDLGLDLRGRLMLLAVIGVCAGVFGIYKWLTRSDLGEPCRKDDDCSSRICLPGPDPLSMAAPREEGDVLVIRRSVYPGTCTQPCEDGECPAGWHCATIRETSWTQFYRPEVEEKQLCFAPGDPQLANTGDGVE